jgi:hypothetical protein
VEELERECSRRVFSRVFLPRLVRENSCDEGA